MATQDILSYFYKIFEPWLVTQGRMFYINSFIEDLGAGASTVVLGRVPVDRKVRFIHRTTGHTADSFLQVELHEDVTVSDDGTEEEAFSYNRNRLVTPGFKVFSGPTITDSGKRIDNTHILGSGTVGGEKVASSSIDPNVAQRELKQDTDYTLTFTNTSSDPCNVSSFLIWYEEDL